MNAPEDQLRVKRRRATIFLLCIVGVPLLLLALYMATIGRPPLAGENRHDFGYMTIYGERSQAAHTFKLTNRTGSPIVINDMRVTCACAAAVMDREVVEPGETLEIHTTITVSRAGKHESEIRLFMEGRGTRTLYVSAIGRPAQRLKASEQFIQLVPGRTQQLAIAAEIWADEWSNTDDVPEPILETPEGVTATLTSWSMGRRANAARGVPAAWGGRIELALDDEVSELPYDAELRVWLDSDHLQDYERSLEVPVAVSNHPPY